MAVIVALGVLVAGCSAGDAPKEAADPGGDASSSSVDSVLVIDGKDVGAAPSARRSEEAAKRPPRKRTRERAIRVEDRWPEPLRNDDGTIDDGPDPFEAERIQVQPLPIEDDATTTAAIDAAAASMRRVEREDWDRWLAAGNRRSPWQQGNDAFAASLVEITVERCGGARTVATGVVLANETVVTTVHAIETATKRVRVSPAVGSGPRIAAMVRYLDVDDDIAVLKVPGLRIAPMPMYTSAGTEPRLGYAYGIANGNISGALRRTPVMVSAEETSIRLEQPDGFAEQISDRSVQTLVGGITTGFSGGVVAATNDASLATGFGFHGLIRARVPFRADTAGIVVPSRVVRDALTASAGVDEWFEHGPGGCAQWRR